MCSSSTQTRVSCQRSVGVFFCRLVRAAGYLRPTTTSRSAPGPRRSKSASTTGETLRDASSQLVIYFFCLHRAAFIAVAFRVEVFKHTDSGCVSASVGVWPVYFSGRGCFQMQAYLLQAPPEGSRLERSGRFARRTSSLIKAIRPLSIYANPPPES